MTQSQVILEHLKKHGSITQKEAIDNYGIMRLGARIWDLKRKGHGNHVQILTKGDGTRDFDLLDGDDWYGITIDGTYKGHLLEKYIEPLCKAHLNHTNTWVSFEPVLDAKEVLLSIRCVAPFANKVKIGKLNYHHSDIDWKAFGVQAEALCRELGLDYTIKESLRREMEKP